MALWARSTLKTPRHVDKRREGGWSLLTNQQAFGTPTAAIDVYECM
jgi:hypothetical protein